ARVVDAEVAEGAAAVAEQRVGGAGVGAAQRRGRLGGVVERERRERRRQVGQDQGADQRQAQLHVRPLLSLGILGTRFVRSQLGVSPLARLGALVLLLLLVGCGGGEIAITPRAIPSATPPATPARQPPTATPRR